MLEKIKTQFGNTKVYSAHNDNALKDNGSIVVVPGYSEGISHTKQLVDALASKGFSVGTYNHPRRDEKGITRIMDPVQRQAEVLLSFIEATVPKGTKISAVAHSLGAGAVTEAVRKRPDRFKNVILFQPVGMSGQHSVPELAAKTTKKVINDHIKALQSKNPVSQLSHVLKTQIAGAGVLVSNPYLALREAKAAGNYDIASGLAEIATHGIPVHIVTANSDELFDQNKINSYYPQVADNVASMSTVSDKNAGHDTFWTQPENTAEIVRQLIV